MSQEEVYNTRDRSYSAWHRRKSSGRFIGIEKAQLLAMIDLDASLYIEYDDGTKEPIALIETAQDVGQKYKPVTVTRNLAKRADLPCFVLLYTLSQKRNPADTRWMDIEKFRSKLMWPIQENTWTINTPKEWAEILIRMREWQCKKLDIELFPEFITKEPIAF